MSERLKVGWLDFDDCFFGLIGNWQLAQFGTDAVVGFLRGEDVGNLINRRLIVNLCPVFR